MTDHAGETALITGASSGTEAIAPGSVGTDLLDTTSDPSSATSSVRTPPPSKRSPWPTSVMSSSTQPRHHRT
ncbi:hypothetical protein [Microbacterium sp. CH12i]|uniref:hypothetical protein n=1 Tax=Microbacterium sp. CH12i TaxID=1479651 RepID=UPI00126860AD|nr:hypothetical protein [Microbacterium sp. CH12i]